MRTTLSLDDDVFMLVKSLAERQRKSAGEIVSQLVRSALQQQTGHAAAAPERLRNGIPLLAVQPHGGMVTTELVNQLRDELA